MNRSSLFAIVALFLAGSPAFAQFGGMGGRGGALDGVGTPAMTMRDARIAAANLTAVQRSAEVEMEGGQILSGKIDLRPIVVDGDLGQYVLTPEKIKMIRFLKPVNDVKPANEPGPNNNVERAGAEELAPMPDAVQNRAAALRARRVAGGFGGGPMVADPNSPTGAAVLARGKVVTTRDKEIIGSIHIPSDFRLELDFGALVLAPAKLRSITFTDDRAKDTPTAPVRTPEDAGKPGPAEQPSTPRYVRQDACVIVISPVGDRVSLYHFETKTSQSLALSGSKDAPVEVTPILTGDLVALSLKGPKLTRIAVADTARGKWHAQDLRTPFDGEIVPIVAARVVVYKVGREVHAYGADAERWDLVELPEGIQAMPSVTPGSVTIEGHGHIFTFTSKTGKWDHVDVRNLLDGVKDRKEK